MSKYGRIDKLSVEDFKELVATSQSRMDILLKLGIAAKGSNFKTLNKHLIKHSLLEDLNNKMKSSKINLKNHKLLTRDLLLSDVLVANSNYTSTHRLKLLLFKFLLKEKVCEICNISTWLGSDISLQLHHRDGVRNNNILENLQILCPNCHSQTSTFAGKSTKKLIGV